MHCLSAIKKNPALSAEIDDKFGCMGVPSNNLNY